MKASRKGTRLNDGQYFHQPLPHARKMMRAMCLMPRVPALHVNPLFITESLLRDPNFKVTMRTKDRGRQLDAKQRSVEMALLSCTSESSVLEDKFPRSRFREVHVETELDFPGKPLSSLTDCSQVPLQRESNSNLLYRVEREIHKKRESVENHANGGKVHAEERKQTNSRTDGGLKQALYHFFTLIIGKRSSASTKKRTKESPVHGYYIFGFSINRMFKGNKRKKKWKHDGNENRKLPTYRADDLCIVDEACREGKVFRKTESEKSRENVASMLVRQIQRTRDKNLRVALLEQELQARLPEEEDRYGGRILDVKLPPRQLSSPLC